MSINRHIDRYEEEDKDHVKHIHERIRTEYIEDDFNNIKDNMVNTTFSAQARSLLILSVYFLLFLGIDKLIDKI